MRPIAIHALAFLVGVATAGASLWFAFGQSTASREGSTSPTAPLPAHAKSEPADLASPNGQAENLQPQQIVEAAMLRIRAADARERSCHVSLLLAELHDAGPDASAALVKLLASGEDWSLSSYHPRMFYYGGPRSLREALLLTLLEEREKATSPDGPYEKIHRSTLPDDLRPICLAEAARDLTITESAETAIRRIALLERQDPGAHRAEAVAAMQRIWAGTRNGDQPALESNFYPLQVMAHYGAEELLPTVEAVAFENPEFYLREYLGGLWTLSAATRAQAMQRIFTDPSLRDFLQKNPSLEMLDYQIPANRQFAAGWFAGDHSANRKNLIIQRLAQSNSDGYGGTPYKLVEKPAPARGKPRDIEQAQARLKFLDEIAPSCPEPAVQEELASARAALLRSIKEATSPSEEDPFSGLPPLPR